MTSTRMMDVRRGGKSVGCIEARFVEGADRMRYELALMMGVHGPSVLRGVVSFYSDGSASVWPRDTKGHKLGRPYFFTPHTFTCGPDDAQA